MPQPGIEPTTVSGVAPNSRDLLKDTLPTELHGRLLGTNLYCLPMVLNTYANCFARRLWVHNPNTLMLELFLKWVRSTALKLLYANKCWTRALFTLSRTYSVHILISA